MMTTSQWRAKYPEQAKERDAQRTELQIQQDRIKEDRRNLEEHYRYLQSAEYREKVRKDNQEREEEEQRQLLKKQEERYVKVNKVVFTTTRKPAKTKKHEKRSVEAQRLATKLEAMTPKERDKKKEDNKLYMREYRAGKQLSVKDCQAVAERTAKYRSNMDQAMQEKAREKAKTDMQNFRRNEKRRKEEDPEAYAQETIMLRTRRHHLMTWKKNRREEQFNMQTLQYDELVIYWNEEKQKNLYVSPTAEHFHHNGPLPSTCTCRTGKTICYKERRVLLVGQRENRDGDFRKCTIHSVYRFLEKVTDLKDTSFLASILRRKH